jgi:hypothetical protein
MLLKAIAPATEPDSHVNIINYMRNNIPFTIVMAMAMVNKYAFNNIVCTDGMHVGIFFTFLILSTLDVVWTVYHCKVDFTVNYPHSMNQWRKYAIVRSSTSLLAFFSINYFVHKGVPFNCFFGYNSVAANVILYLSFATVATVSYIEHYYWKKLPIPLLPPAQMSVSF